MCITEGFSHSIPNKPHCRTVFQVLKLKEGSRKKGEPLYYVIMGVNKFNKNLKWQICCCACSIEKLLQNLTKIQAMV